MLKRDLAVEKIKEMREYYQRELGSDFIIPQDVKVESFLLTIEHFFKTSDNHELVLRFLVQNYSIQVTEEQFKQVLEKTCEYINFFLKLIS